ncbi:MAG: hypothetical protein IT258_18350, partial [Saprospiraceae bacterium]|nr:hypothetical protein [Saprospiraceae bacterium]
HWYYGRYREQTTAAARSRSPYHGFMTNNFLISKSIFLSILFDETLRQYGHEDTLFGMKLAERKVPILHIDNPLEHIGLESTEVFLQKTRQGLENLVKLRAEGKPIDTKLTKAFDFLEKWQLSVFLPAFERFLFVKLRNGSLNLRLFDLYKLAVLKRISLEFKSK